ncbi:Aquaporin (major intrinsic protein family) [Phaffia rhodozyma]|uniref:Aquaporin (Major intrinsic protein family) n=1 Tax=Phaffia rhodozyma TaxID=264483 RepID=A0A0F7SJT2_PHARH|nr:Aquaporin (major intrinsic protein family) [Phaffia rhodozyma]
MSNLERQPLLYTQSSSTSYPKSSFSDRLARFRHIYRQPLAEFIGTAILVFVGDGVVAQYLLSRGLNGSWLGINIAWAGGVMLGSLTAGSISGAHLNPAVSLCFALFTRNGQRFPLRKLPGYILSQMLGGFAGAALVYAGYSHQIDVYEHGSRTVPGGEVLSNGLGPTAGIFCTYPLPNSTLWSNFFSEFLASALLMFGIFVITSKRNEVLALSGHFAVFILLILIGTSLGYQTGYGINAARDLAPRIFTYFVYGSEVFTAKNINGNSYWWIPVVAPFFGTIAGASVFTLFIGEPDGVAEGMMGGLPDDQDQPDGF